VLLLSVFYGRDLFAIIFTLKKKDMNLSVDNLQKPSNKKWKAIADFFLYSLPLYLGAVMALPVSEEIKLWVTFGITILTVTLKGLTKFTSEDV
jgi:predicted phosphoadenosine phosphosulfate sulfurtransferase